MNECNKNWSFRKKRFSCCADMFLEVTRGVSAKAATINASWKLRWKCWNFKYLTYSLFDYLYFKLISVAVMAQEPNHSSCNQSTFTFNRIAQLLWSEQISADTFSSNAWFALQSRNRDEAWLACIVADAFVPATDRERKDREFQECSPPVPGMAWKIHVLLQKQRQPQTNRYDDKMLCRNS